VLLRGVKRDEVVRGQAVAAPGSISSATSFVAQMYVLKANEGGRHTPFVTNYRPRAWSSGERSESEGGSTVFSVLLRCNERELQGQLPDNLAFVAPGDNLEVAVMTDKPVPIMVGAGFILREGGRTVAAGTVLSLL
jgi:elongation factor Tu